MLTRLPAGLQILRLQPRLRQQHRLDAHLGQPRVQRHRAGPGGGEAQEQRGAGGRVDLWEEAGGVI